MEWLVNNWGMIAGVAVPAVLAAGWAIAQLTPFEWDNKVVMFCRQAWGMVPVGETDPENMGR